MTDLLNPRTASSPVPERAIITSCLARIRRRLWGVRLGERLALAVAWSAGIGVTLVGARLLREAHPSWAAAVPAVPLVAALLLWQKAKAWGRGASGGVLTPNLVRLAAGITAAAAVAASVLMLIPAGASVPVWAMAAAPVAVFVLAAVASVRMIDTRTAAIFVDQRAGLEERVSTALEMLETPAANDLEAAFRAPVVESAVAACQQVKRAKVGYRRLDSRAYAVAATVALAATGVSFLTPLPASVPPLKRQYVQVQESVRKLADVLKEEEQKRPPEDKTIQQALKPLNDKIAEIKRGDMSPMEAMAALEQARSEMRRQQEAREASDKVQDALRQMESTKDIASAADPLRDAKAQGAAGDQNAGAKQQQAKAGLNKATQELANKMQSGNMSADDRKKLADGLRQAAANAGADSQLQRDLQNAANAAENGNGQDLANNLESAADRMAEQQATQTLSQDAVNRAMEAIDKMAQNGMSAGEQSARTEGGGEGQSQGQNGGSGTCPNCGGAGCDQCQGTGKSGGQSMAQADTGQPGGQQNSGEGKGEGSGKGDGKDRGSGSTNFHQRGGPGDQYQGTDDGGTGTFVRIYDQKKIDSAGKQEKVGGKINPLGQAIGTVQVMGEGEKTDPDIKSYADELPGARQRAMDDLNRQEIPPQYQEMVKEFYSQPAPKAPAAPAPAAK
jgi:hypothetical protein